MCRFCNAMPIRACVQGLPMQGCLDGSPTAKSSVDASFVGVEAALLNANETRRPTRSSRITIPGSRSTDLVN